MKVLIVDVKIVRGLIRVIERVRICVQAQVETGMESESRIWD